MTTHKDYIKWLLDNKIMLGFLKDLTINKNTKLHSTLTASVFTILNKHTDWGLLM